MDRGEPDETRHYAAIDLGATSGRVVVGSVGATGATFHEVHRFANEPLGTGDDLRWDVASLFDESLTGLRAAVQWCTDRGASLSGIGVDSWGVDFVLIDEHDQPGPLTHYRASFDYPSTLASRGLTEQAIFALSGVPDQYINSANRLSLAARAADRVGARVLFVPDYWIYLLSGELGTEPSIASTSQLLAARGRNWSPELMKAFGITNLVLPKVNEPGTVAGNTTARITELIGASVPVPVVRVLEHDTASAFAMAVAARPGDAVTGLISSGTWSVVGLCVTEPVISSEALLEGFTNELGLNSVLFIRNLTGMWILEQCRRDWFTDGIPVPDLPELVALAAALGTEVGETFDVSDARLALPGRMTDRVISLSIAAGRSMDVDSPAHIARAIFDSLAVAYSETLAAAARLTSTHLTDVRIVGGGALNALLCQLTADLLDVPITAGPIEASSLGNVAVQATAVGQLSHPRQAYLRADAEIPSTRYRPLDRVREETK